GHIVGAEVAVQAGGRAERERAAEDCGGFAIDEAGVVDAEGWVGVAVLLRRGIDADRQRGLVDGEGDRCAAGGGVVVAAGVGGGGGAALAGVRREGQRAAEDAAGFTVDEAGVGDGEGRIGVAVGLRRVSGLHGQRRLGDAERDRGTVGGGVVGGAGIVGDDLI